MPAFYVTTECNSFRTLVGAVAGFLGMPYIKFIYTQKMDRKPQDGAEETARHL